MCNQFGELCQTGNDLFM